MLIFQPAEEGAPPGEEGGAPLMVKEGVFKDFKPDAVFGMHVVSTIAVGTVGVRAGGAMASSDTFRIIVHGRQSHGAMPWMGIDPIVTAAEIVTSAQTIVSRQLNIGKDPAVVTFGIFNGGQRFNIVPETVELQGTDPRLRRRHAQTGSDQSEKYCRACRRRQWRDGRCANSEPQGAIRSITTIRR